MKVKCPSCHSEHSLDAMIDGQAGGELMMLLIELDRNLARPLVSYLSLFRSPSRALGWDRSIRLLREVLALEVNQTRLASALAKTVTVLREKQSGKNWKPLSNHNYLIRVLEEMPAEPAGALVPHKASHDSQPTPPAQLSKTARAMIRLESRKSDRRR